MPDVSRRSLGEEKLLLAEALCVEAGVALEDVRVVVSPYRVCPIGAHVDHQGGPALGMAIDAHTLLAFAPQSGGRVTLSSGNFDGRVEFDLSDPTGRAAPGPGWGAYPRGVASVFCQEVPGARAGFVGRLQGSLPGGGLSSSASVLLACFTALADVNGCPLDDAALVRHSRRVENDFVGVASGILDPASIVGGRRDELLCIETDEDRWSSSPLGGGAEAPVILVAFTGITRQLVHSGFNDRVEECHRAAEALLEAAGRPPSAGRRARLGDLSDDEFERFGPGLAVALGLRARHFFGERQRVREGLACWRDGDLAGFGERMNASCQSSIHQYQTGSPELVALQDVLVSNSDVIGARFSGGGFGGCSVALVHRAAAAEAAVRVQRDFARACPELSDRMRVFVVETDDGLRIETHSEGGDRA